MTEHLLKIAPTLESLRDRRDEILALAEHYGAYNVRVFGSVARGEALPDSDVDILVAFPPNYRLLSHAGLVAALMDLLKYTVDVSVEANLREDYRSTILRDVVPL